jgi:hypothetical protein
LVVNLRQGPWRLTNEADGVVFDMNADGAATRVAWTAPGSDLGFIALDRDSNGRIDDGSELFGQFTPLADGAHAANGFDALNQYDTNDDGAIDAGDAVWSRLLLWIDSDHDGVSQPNELRLVGSTSVLSLSTGYRTIARRDEYGNIFRYMSEVRFTSGLRASYFDVFFRNEP